MGKRILVVDDDLMCLKTVQKYLTEGSYEVLGALSGMQALHMAEETKFDLLLLDIEMPGMSGFATLEQLRQLPGGKQLPVIFFTGRQDRDTVKCCAAAGAEGYIAKPIEKRTLLLRVKEVFDRLPNQAEKKTLLILNRNMEQLKQRKLELADSYRVIGITSLHQGEDYFTSHSADIMIISEQLILNEGIEAFRAFREIPEAAKAAVLLMGEESQPSDALSLKELGIREYRNHAVSAGELQEILKEILN